MKNLCSILIDRSEIIYMEFVIGYILMGVLAALLITVIILQCIILRKSSKISTQSRQRPYSGGAYAGTAICRNCAEQFDSAQKVCPRCGTPR